MAWTFSGTGVQVVVQLAALAALGRLVTPAEFGLMGAAAVIIACSQIVSQIGVGPAIIQRKTVEHVHLRVAVTLSFMLGSLLGAIVWLGAPAIAAFYRMPEVERQEAALVALDGDTPGDLVVRWNLHRGFLYQAARQRYEPFDKLVDEDPESRRILARMAARAFKAGRKVWITANNKAEGSAPLSLLKLAEEIANNLQ